MKRTMKSPVFLLAAISLGLCFTLFCDAAPVDIRSTSTLTPETESASWGFLSHLGASNGFFNAFVASISVIILSELGDKTFFIAAIMAMRFSRLAVFFGAITALSLMTVLSAVLGAATTVIPREITHYVSTALFAIFGIRMLKEGYSMSAEEGHEEYEEASRTISRRESENVREPATDGDVESAIPYSRWKTVRRRMMLVLSRVFLEAFTMTFLAEWGDRSQLATIVLAARENAYGVTIGAVIGHSLCTLLAVLGGRIVAQRISVRTVTLIGGVVFLIFAVTALIIGPGGQ